MELTNVSLLIAFSALVFLMAVGFTFLEAGLVEHKSVSSVITKNIVAICITTVAFYLIGSHVMKTGSIVSALTSTPMGSGQTETVGWLFKSLFVVASSSIVSGAVAVRVKIPAFMIFCAVNGAIIYPTIGYWVWGSGWLRELGYTDFAGASVVHLSGGCASLAAIILLGPRLNRFQKRDEPASENMLSPSSIPLTTLGTFLLWLGWYGFNGGSSLPIDGSEGIQEIARVIVNTHWGGIGGFTFGLLISIVTTRRWDVVGTLNAGLAGLVVTTAAPINGGSVLFIILGFLGGGIMHATKIALEKMKIDDVVDAVPVHLTPGLFSIVAAAWHEDVNLGVQLIGAAAILAFSLSTQAAIWWAMKKTIGIRISTSAEIAGSDAAHMSQSAYNLIDADMRHFSYFATHDLKEPLRSITSLAQLAELDSTSRQGKDYLRRIQDAAKSMRSLIDDLIVYSNLNNVVTRHETIDVKSLVEGIFKDEIRIYGTETGVQLNCVDLPELACDPVLIRHVIKNLVGNAVKYRRTDTPSHVEAKAALVKNAWHISISDNGKGIEKDYLNRVFEAFSRFDDNPEIPGNGIGLAIVRKAVFKMGGTVWVQSRVNSGTTITFTVPNIELYPKAEN